MKLAGRDLSTTFCFISRLDSSRNSNHSSPPTPQCLVETKDKENMDKMVALGKELDGVKIEWETNINLYNQVSTSCAFAWHWERFWIVNSAFFFEHPPL